MVVIRHLEHAPWLHVKPLVALFDIYRKAGFEIRPVGGCIRDALLNQPIHDWDLTTNAPPEKSLEICENAGLHVIPTGLKHGTITAIFEHTPFEITTLRIDEETDGRFAKVAWTADWQADAMRRDFTINTLYGDQNGDITDYTGGIADLTNRIIRFVGNAEMRVQEDYLRILRFFRFMARLGNFDNIDKPSLDACINNQSGLNQISTERIRDELFKIFVSPQRYLAVNLMAQYQIFDTISLSIENLELLQLDIAETQLQFLPSALRTFSFILPKSADWRTIASRLKLSNQEKKHLLNIQQYLDLPLTTHNLRAIAYHSGIEVCQDVFAIRYIADAPTLDWNNLTPPPFPVTGKDLIRLGIKADKNMGLILERLEQNYIDSDFSLSKTELLEKI